MEPKRTLIGYIIEKGEKFKLIAPVFENRYSPFKDYFFNLKSEIEKKLTVNQNKGKSDRDVINYRTLYKYFNKFCNTGAWHNKTQIKSLSGFKDFFEFKVMETGLRVICYYDRDQSAIIIYSFSKGGKGGKELNKEMKDHINNLRRSYEDYKRRLKNGGFYEEL